MTTEHNRRTGGHDAYYMVAVWYGLTDVQHSDILNEYIEE